MKSDGEALVLNAEAVAAGIETPVVLEAELNQLLRPHQREGVLFMYAAIARGAGCILADTMGLGKTLQALALLWTVVNSGPGPVGLGPRSPTPLVRKAIVVCPCSLCANWRAEVKKWLGDQRLKPTTVVAGGGRAKVETQLRQFRDYTTQRMLIVSYEQLRQHAQLVDVACDLLICDEGHRLRSQGTATAKQLDAMRCRRRILLSGTPLQNDLDELFHCGRFVRPDLFPDAFAFQRLIAQPLVRSREPLATHEECATGERAARELEALTSQFVLRRTSEILERSLPTRREFILRLRMAPPQVHAYQAVLAEFHTGSTSQDMARALKTMVALRLLCNDAGDMMQSAGGAGQRFATPRKVSSQSAALGQYGDMEDSSDEEPVCVLSASVPQGLSSYEGKVAEAARLQASTKSAVLVALLKRILKDAPGDRIVVVSNFKRTLLRLQRLLSILPVRISVLCGSTAPAKRLEIVNSLNASGPAGIDVLLLSSKAGGVGLNLIGANRLVLYDPDWNPANDSQAMARIWREGQRKEVFIYRFVLAGTLEEKICQRQHAKADLAAISVDGISSALSSTPRLSWEELRRVFKLEGYGEDGVPLSASMPSSALLGAAVPTSSSELGNALVDGEDLRDAVLTVHVVGGQCSGAARPRVADSAVVDDAETRSRLPAWPPATPQRAPQAAGPIDGIAAPSSSWGAAASSPRSASLSISTRFEFLRRPPSQTPVLQHNWQMASPRQATVDQVPRSPVQVSPEASEHAPRPLMPRVMVAGEALEANTRKRFRTSSTPSHGINGKSRRQTTSTPGVEGVHDALETDRTRRLSPGDSSACSNNEMATSSAFRWSLPGNASASRGHTAAAASPDSSASAFLWSVWSQDS